MIEYIDFVSEIPWEKMEILLKLGEEFGFDPSSSIESEQYFPKLVSNYQVSDAKLINLLREDIKRDFRVIGEKPKWVQNPEWQFNNGKPMEFVGQFIRKVSDSEQPKKNSLPKR